jgi:hypothetical protein
MRLISFSIVILFVLLSSASFAQQTHSPPYFTGPLPEVFASTGRSIEGPNNTTLIVKAVPCTVAARWTDGTTTCVGIPDSFRKSRR